jgi:mercuric ion transport protein
MHAQNAAVVGSLFGAVAASSCCILPLAFFTLGISGAWIANLTALAPYQPYFIAAAVVFLAIGYWLVYRPVTQECAEGAACAKPLPRRLVKTGLFAATALVAASVLFDVFAPVFLGT